MPLESQRTDDELLAAVVAGEGAAFATFYRRHGRVEDRSRVLEERDYADIARTLHCSELVARRRVSRGL